MLKSIYNRRGNVMIYIYKKYQVGYSLVCSAIIICMIASFIFLNIPLKLYPLVTIIASILVIAAAVTFTNLTYKMIAKEVMVLFNECHMNEFINTLRGLFVKKKGSTVDSFYNANLAAGYSCLGDYDMVYECCKNIKAKNYKAEYHKYMIDYYLSKDKPELVQRGIDELRKLTVKMKQPYKDVYENSIKTAEYSLRIKNGDYEGAEEFFLEVLTTTSPIQPITKVSYSFAIGNLLVLKGEPERAKEYLQTAYELGGDTKFRIRAEELLKNITKKVSF